MEPPTYDRVRPVPEKPDTPLVGIGTYRTTVIDVNDLEQGYRFWSAVTGLDVIGSETGWHDRFGYLGRKDPWKHELILQVVDRIKQDEPNRAHIDVTPNQGIDEAISRIIALGGSVKKPPSLYPDPGLTVTSHLSSIGRSCRTHSETSSAWSTISPMPRSRPSSRPRLREPPRMRNGGLRR